MSKIKKACIIYVNATKDQLARAQAELEQKGYSVCAVLATADAIRKLDSDEGEMPEPIRKCIDDSELCVFLIPEEEATDEGISGAAGLAGQLGKRILGLVGGARTVYPEEFEVAGAMIRMTSARLTSVIEGEDVWEAVDTTPIKDRVIDHQKCQ